MSSLNLEEIQNRFRSFLHEDFQKRRTNFQKYSLRDYAKKVGISVSALSEILNGKRNVSSKLARRVFENLEVSQRTIAFFLKDFNFVKNRPAFMTLSEERYRLIADNKFFSFLALMETRGFISDRQWIADRLQISVDSVDDIIETLVKLELVERDVWGELKLLQTNLQSPDNVPSEANKKSHLQGIEMAKAALENGEFEYRDFSAMLLPINVDLLPKVKAKIRSLYEELSALSETQDKREVFRINIQVFPVTKVRGKK